MQAFWFALDEDRYAIPLAKVLEVARAVAIARLPGAPAVVEGVINVRGRLIPVFDMRLRFGIQAKPLELSDVLIVAEYRSDAVAFRADRPGWPIEVEERQLSGASGALAASRYVSGVTQTDEGLVVIHDLDEFLGQTERAVLDEVMAAARAESA